MKTSQHASPYSNRLALFRRPTKAVSTMAFAAFLALGASAVHAATEVWDPDNGFTTSGTFDSGTWDTTTSNWYLSGTGDTTFVSTNYAQFAGTNTGNPATATVTVGSGGITAAGVYFTTTGYTIAGTPSLTLTASGSTASTAGAAAISTNGSGVTEAISAPVIFGAAASSSQYIIVGSGDTLNMSGGLTTTNSGIQAFVVGPGTFNFSGPTFTTSKLSIKGNAIFNSTGTVSLNSATGIGDASNGTLNVSAGTFATTGLLFLGNTTTSTSDTGTLTISGTGAVSTASNVNFGNGTASNMGDGTGILNINAGSFSTGTSTGNINLGNAGSGQGTINLNGGTLSTNSTIAPGSYTGTISGVTKLSAFNFNGGTLTATGSNLSISTAVTTKVLAGGANISVGTDIGITIATPLLTGVTSGTDGGLDKTGGGSLILTGGNTYNGTTVLGGGILAVNGTGTLGTGSIEFVSNVGAIGTNDASHTFTNPITQSGAGAFTFGSASFTGALNFTSGATFTVGGGSTPSRNFVVNANTTLAANLAGGALKSTLSGAGTLTLSGNSGAINGGAFTVTNTGGVFFNGTLGGTGGAPTVSATTTGATIGGSGRLYGPVSMAAGAILTPGAAGANSIGTLTTGALTLTSTTNLVFDLGTTAAGGSDRVAVNGNLTLGGTLTVNQQAGFGAGSYELFSYTGTLDSTTNTTTVSSAPAGFNYAIDTTSVANQVLLDVTPVPEPATYLGGLLMVGAMGWELRGRFNRRTDV